jgi:AhpD family alkylhydroperoxidase
MKSWRIFLYPTVYPALPAPLKQYPETARHLLGLAEALLRGPSSLTTAEREVIATYISSQNECVFCMSSHGAAARGRHSCRTSACRWSR